MAAAFPSFMEIKPTVPRWVWHVLRGFTMLAGVGLGVLLLVQPKTGLLVLWGLVVPVLPLLFFVAPGLWRNVCPLAGMNQAPRHLGISAARTLPEGVRKVAYTLGIAAFVTLVALRRVVFNKDGAASGVLVLALLALPMLGGFIFKGKSGWCSTFCPLLPVQRMYGQTPFVPVRNGHCAPCVGCAKNCYDFNPEVAYLADVYDEDRHYTGPRKVFVGAFPGLILGFFLVPGPPKASALEMLLGMGACVLASAGAFFVLDAFVKVTTHKLTSLFAMIALNAFYFFNVPALERTIAKLTGSGVDAPVLWAVRGAILVASGVWIARTWGKERKFLEQVLAPPALRVGIKGSTLLQARGAAAKTGAGPSLTILPEKKNVAVTRGRTVLEVVEAAGCKIESGCRMGICGADPVAVVDGLGNLSPIGADERATLERLNLAENTRMACCARVEGAVSVKLTPDRPTKKRARTMEGFIPSADVKRVVILGNGIAGVTAADLVRSYHPDAELHIVGREAHNLYNRMAITRLVYGRSAMQGLYLNPESWAEENKITAWLNTHAQAIDCAKREVLLGTGDKLGYDRLILALGSRSFVAPIEGFGAPGCFVLREAKDAMDLRAFAQTRRAERAVVAGGGLLGIEAAYAVHKLGLRVAVLEREARLLPMQLDARASELLRAYLEGLGITVIVRAKAARIVGSPHVERIDLEGGQTLFAQTFLACMGIKPNTELAKAAGLDVKRGVIVDDAMRTSAPEIYACGDVAEFAGNVPGLWTTAVDQAKVAAMNALGAHKKYVAAPPSTILKVAGIDLMSMGRVEPGPREFEVVIEDPQRRSYRKVVMSGGRVVGAILLGHPELSSPLLGIIKAGTDISRAVTIEQLRAGDWSGLSKVAPD